MLIFAQQNFRVFLLLHVKSATACETAVTQVAIASIAALLFTEFSIYTYQISLVHLAQRCFLRVPFVCLLLHRFDKPFEHVTVMHAGQRVLPDGC